MGRTGIFGFLFTLILSSLAGAQVERPPLDYAGYEGYVAATESGTYQEVVQELVALSEAGLLKGELLLDLLAQLDSASLNVLVRDQRHSRKRWSLIDTAPHWSEEQVEILKQALLRHPYRISTLMGPDALARRAPLDEAQQQFWGDFLSDVIQRMDQVSILDAFGVLPLLKKPWAFAFEGSILRILTAGPKIQGSTAELLYEALAHAELEDKKAVLEVVIEKDLQASYHTSEITKVRESGANPKESEIQQAETVLMGLIIKRMNGFEVFPIDQALNEAENSGENSEGIKLLRTKMWRDFILQKLIDKMARGEGAGPANSIQRAAKEFQRALQGRPFVDSNPAIRFSQDIAQDIKESTIDTGTSNGSSCRQVLSGS